MALVDLRAAIWTRLEERRRRQKLRRELLEYRSSVERHELQAILIRYDTTLDELLTGHDGMRSAQPVDRGSAQLVDRGSGEAVREAAWELDLDA